MSVRDIGYIGIAQILVGMDIRKGLVKTMDIMRGLNHFHLNIYYKKFPSTIVIFNYMDT